MWVSFLANTYLGWIKVTSVALTITSVKTVTFNVLLYYYSYGVCMHQKCIHDLDETVVDWFDQIVCSVVVSCSLWTDNIWCKLVTFTWLVHKVSLLQPTKSFCWICVCCRWLLIFWHLASDHPMFCSWIQDFFIYLITFWMHILYHVRLANLESIKKHV